jgi:hypothetical protein
LRITRRIFIAKTACAIGDIVEVDNETACNLLNSGQAEIADDATRARFKSATVRGDWHDPALEDAEHKPVLRVIRNAA